MRLRLCAQQGRVPRRGAGLPEATFERVCGVGDAARLRQQAREEEPGAAVAGVARGEARADVRLGGVGGRAGDEGDERAQEGDVRCDGFA